MAKVIVQIGNQDHTLLCDDGQEGRLRQLAQEFDGIVNSANTKHEGLGAHEAVILAALSVLDEYDEAKTRWAKASPDERAAEWAADQLDRVSATLEKALGG